MPEYSVTYALWATFQIEAESEAEAEETARRELEADPEWKGRAYELQGIEEIS